MPIPFGLTAAQFETRYRRCLENHSKALIKDIRELLKEPTASDITSVSVEIFLDEYGESGPRVGVYFLGLNNKVDNKDSSIFAGKHRPLGDYLDGIEVFDEKYFDIEEFNGLQLQGNVLKSWFAECWWKAGGWDYKYCAEVSVHDGYGDGRSVELANGR